MGTKAPKTIRVKSDKYSDKSIKFNEFELNFNRDGIAEVKINGEEEMVRLRKMLLEYKDFVYLLDEETSRKMEAEKQKDTKYLLQQLSEKEAYITELEGKVSTLTAENLDLKAKYESLLKVKGSALDNLGKEEEEEDEVNDENNENNKEEQNNSEKKELNEEAIPVGNKIADEKGITEEELQAKTVVQLKEILSSVFGEFEDEWKPLKKKDDIIFYILNKVKAEEENNKE